LKEQVLIADERVLTVRKEMQLEIDRLTIQISVYLEKITKKDADMRKLYIKIDALNRERGGIEELKKRHL
jgi:peptidoglycan hydrolase CwlO-like protein